MIEKVKSRDQRKGEREISFHEEEKETTAMRLTLIDILWRKGMPCTLIAVPTCLQVQFCPIEIRDSHRTVLSLCSERVYCVET